MKKKYLMISLSLTVIINLVLLIPNFNPPAVSAETITLKFANYFPPPARHSKLIEEFAERLEERTQGRIKIGADVVAAAEYSAILIAHYLVIPVGQFPVDFLVGVPAVIKGVDARLGLTGCEGDQGCAEE